MFNISAGNVFGSSIDASEITDGAVTTAKLADSAVTSAKLDSALSLPMILAAGTFDGTTGGDLDSVSISGLSATDMIRVFWIGQDDASSTFKVQIKISDGTNTVTLDPAAVNNVFQYGDIKIINVLNDTSNLAYFGLRDDNNAGSTPTSYWARTDPMNTDWFIGSWTLTLSCTGGSGSLRTASWIVEKITTT